MHYYNKKQDTKTIKMQESNLSVANKIGSPSPNFSASTSTPNDHHVNSRPYSYVRKNQLPKLQQIHPNNRLQIIITPSTSPSSSLMACTCFCFALTYVSHFYMGSLRVEDCCLVITYSKFLI